MGRNATPFTRRPNGFLYARKYVNGKRKLLSLGTRDENEAITRLPYVQKTEKNWPEFVKYIEKMSENWPNELPFKIFQVPGATFEPPKEIMVSKLTFMKQIQQAILEDRFDYNNEKGEVIFQLTNITEDAFEALEKIKKELAFTDQYELIKEFYLKTMIDMYADKTASERWAKIWLGYLKERNIKAWTQIDENFCRDFLEWRKKTKIQRNGRKGVIPKARTINRHFKFIKKSLTKAAERRYITMNPIIDWPDEILEEPLPPEIKPKLTEKQLKAVLKNKRLQQDYIYIGKNKIKLSYKIRDFICLLFAACKRRKEILSLKIENIYFKERFACYREWKNKNKKHKYSIAKAFYLTEEMIRLLKRIIGKRNSGLIFETPPEAIRTEKSPGWANGDRISDIFKKVVEEVVKRNDITLKNLRQSAIAIMRKKGLNVEEREYTIGHFNNAKIRSFYEDTDLESIGREIAPLTKKGVVVLSECVKEFLTN